MSIAPSPDPDAGLSCQTLTYKTIGEIELQLELCRPIAPAENRPGVVLVHGGGWSGGSRGQFAWHARDLARRGFVSATISYRLIRQSPYPAAIDDCQAAVRWLRKHATEFGLDPHRLGAVGSSAGGHLVACLGVRETRDDSDPDLRGYSSRVSCVVDVHGIHDFPSYTTGSAVPNAALFMGMALVENPGAWNDASPLRFVDGDSAAFLLLHDPGDTTVGIDQSIAMANQLISVGRPVQFIPTPGSGHGFVYGHENPWTKKTWPIAVEWLERYLK